MNAYKSSIKGFTLIETLLVITIMSSMLILFVNYGARQVSQLRRDKTAIQIQQILSAALAYYTSYGTWPITCSFNSTYSSTTWTGTLSTLQTAGYLPSTISLNPYGYGYMVNCDTLTGNGFYVFTSTSSSAEASVIAGELPSAYVSDGNGNPWSIGTYVVTQVTVPGQNLNNARSVNYSGLYHNGACVPVPNCPGYNVNTASCVSGSNCMVPNIMVAPASVSGVNDTGSTTTYPISSFTAYAYGPSTKPYDCLTGTTATACSPLGSSGIASPNGNYWRVCMQVITSKGNVSLTNTGTGTTAWGQYASMMVVTRCTPQSEPIGSDFSVYTR